MSLSDPLSDPSRTPVQARPILGRPRLAGLRTLIALILREMGSTYGRSPGGYLWAVLEPLGAILLLSVGFSLIVRTPALGTSFILFYATGMLPLHMYQNIGGKVANAIRQSRSLLAYPRVVWIDAVLARFLLQLLTQITIFTILISAILILVETRSVLDIVPVIEGLALAALFGLGVGLVNSVLNAFFPIWGSFWTIINRPMFIISGVLFLYEDVSRILQSIMWWNPMLHAIARVRTGFYPTYHGDFVSLAYGFGLSLGLVALGLLLLRRYHRDILED